MPWPPRSGPSTLLTWLRRYAQKSAIELSQCGWIIGGQPHYRLRFEEVREQEPPRATISTQKAYFEVEGRPGSQPDPHPPKESGQGSPEPVRITEVRVHRMVDEQPSERDGAARTPPSRRESYATSDSRVLKPRAAVPEPGSQPRRSSSEHLFSQT